ncbi:MAG: AI-2E family transporter [Bacillota bacterium]|nr:AI-2E family transporter [Bacillota bacterium]
MKAFQKYWLIVSFAILMFLSFQNVSLVLAFLSKMYAIISPIFIGFCIAFILEMPVSFLEKHLKSIPEKYRRGVSILAVFLISVGLLTLALLFIIPPIIDSTIKIVSNLQSYANNVGGLITKIYDTLHIENDFLLQFRDGLKNMLLDVTKFTVDTTYRIVSVTFEFTGTLFKWILAIFFSIYMLASKESLIASAKRFIYAFFDVRVADYLDRVGDNSSKIFKNFIVGEFAVAAIMGLLCFIGMSLLGFPFAHLISSIIALTALIPYVGGFIGPIPSIILIMFVDFSSALGFTIFIVILNLVSGNVIVPKIVGDAIGFDGFWVMVAITIGGGLFGMMGMLFGVPVLAIIYALVGDLIKSRLEVRVGPNEFKKLYED